MIRTMLRAIYEGEWLMLGGDPLVDPSGNDERFAEPMLVHSMHGGWPGNIVLNRVSWFENFGPRPAPDEEDLGTTLVVVLGRSAKAAALYFPDNEHEVLVLEDHEVPVEEEES